MCAHKKESVGLKLIFDRQVLGNLYNKIGNNPTPYLQL